MCCLEVQKSPVLIKRKLQQLTGWIWQNLKVVGPILEASDCQKCFRGDNDIFSYFYLSLLVLCYLRQKYSGQIFWSGLNQQRHQNCRPCMIKSVIVVITTITVIIESWISWAQPSLPTSLSPWSQQESKISFQTVTQCIPRDGIIALEGPPESCLFWKLRQRFDDWWHWDIPFR